MNLHASPQNKQDTSQKSGARVVHLLDRAQPAYQAYQKRFCLCIVVYIYIYIYMI